RLWNADTMAAVKTMNGHSDWVYAVAFSPDGNLLASGSWNGEVKVWKVADGSLVKSFNASPGIVAAVAPKKRTGLWKCQGATELRYTDASRMNTDQGKKEEKRRRADLFN